MKSTSNKKPNPNLRKLANAITLARAGLTLPILVALSSGKFYLAFTLFVLASLSDFIDGWIARAAGGGSSWGAQMDPLSDKILILGPLLWLAKESVLPIWAVWLLITREFLITNWRSNMSNGGPAISLGKAKTILQFLSLYLLLWPQFLYENTFNPKVNSLGLILFWLSLVFAYFSGFSYLRKK